MERKCQRDDTGKGCGSRVRKPGTKMAAAMMLTAILVSRAVVPASAASGTGRLGETGRAYWGQEVGQARWEAAENARKYEVSLYENGTRIKTVPVSGRQVNLSEYMSDGNLYSFEVRAVLADSQKKKYSPGEWVSSEDEQLAKGLGDTDGRFRVYMDGKKYEKYGGDYVVDQWYLIRQRWYYFDQNGYMLTGWQQIDGLWYYLGGDGVMRTGWQQLGDDWYYFKTDGSMATGWLEPAPGEKYYLGEDGKMWSSATVDGYTLDASGLRID